MLSYGISGAKRLTEGTRKTDGSNTGAGLSHKSNSESKRKQDEQPVDIEEDDEEAGSEEGCKDDGKTDLHNSQTPRVDRTSRKNLVRLSPRQTTKAKLIRQKNSLAVPKSEEKHKNFSSTMPDGVQGANSALVQKPTNQSEAKYKHNSFIIQKYLERPLLIDQRKFDIRIWVFLDSKGNAYICKPGYLRTSSYKFELDPDDPDNRFVHLTNIAVQKYTKNFGAHEDGNILNFEQYEEYINKTYPNKNFCMETDLIFKIRQ